MMTNRIDGPVETWRGIDPEWAECGGLSYTNLLVRAPCGEVVQELLKDRQTPKQVADLLEGSPAGPLRNKLAYVYQLRGHDWTQVEASGELALGPDTAQNLSLRLGTQAFIYDWEDVASALYYQIFEHGELVEAFSMFYNNPIYQGEEGENDLHQKRAEGWQISDDHTFEFFTRRGTTLDVESPKECHALLERVVASLGMFVASQPFWFNERLGRVECPQQWNSDVFAEAKVLYHAGTEELHNRHGRR
jgi:hypothetical protein